MGGGDGGDSSVDDDGIGLAFNLDNLASTVTWDYAYGMSTSITTIHNRYGRSETHHSRVVRGLLLAGVRPWR